MTTVTVTYSLNQQYHAFAYVYQQSSCLGKAFRLNAIFTVKNNKKTTTKKRLFREFYTCFGRETKTGVVRNFQDRPMFSLMIRKVSAIESLRLV